MVNKSHKTVTHNAPYQTRLQCAQNLEKLWLAVHKPTESFRAMLRITDSNGNEIGGEGLIFDNVSDSIDS